MSSCTNLILADPLSVSTHGVLDEDIGISVLGWIVKVSQSEPDITIPIGQLLRDAFREWWVRKDFFVPPVGEYTLEGPFTFTHADHKARAESEENSSGLSELVTFEDDKMYIVSTYLRGTKRYQHLRAHQAAAYNLPPTV